MHTTPANTWRNPSISLTESAAHLSPPPTQAFAASGGSGSYYSPSVSFSPALRVSSSLSISVSSRFSFLNFPTNLYVFLPSPLFLSHSFPVFPTVFLSPSLQELNSREQRLQEDTMLLYRQQLSQVRKKAAALLQNDNDCCLALCLSLMRKSRSTLCGTTSRLKTESSST